jgi:hypothetical protein
VEVLRQPPRRRDGDDLRRGERGTGSDHVREKDGLWAVLLWLNILAVRRESVRDILTAHWAEHGRNYYARTTTRAWTRRRRAGLMADLRAGLAGLPGTRAAGLTVAAADDFAYHDPVDGSVSEHQGLRVMFEGGGRAVFRLSGTGTSGATLRVYLERFEPDPSRHAMETADALADIVAAGRGVGRRPRPHGPRPAGRDHLTAPLGATPTPGGVRFAVRSEAAERIWVCLFDAADAETARVPLERGEGHVHSALAPGLRPGGRYGLRADGPYDPARGLWFDPAKLLVDPYAVALDRPFAYDPALAAPRGGPDTAPLVPKAVVTALPPPVAPPPPVFRPGGLIYEAAVRPLTLLHPEIPETQRGTVAALAHPAMLRHLARLGVSAVELMPVTAWIDERHLARLSLSNGWGYNPVAMMALDPRLCPGGIEELRATGAGAAQGGIGVILDVVFNHTGESDAAGPTLSLRGLDARAYFRHRPTGAGQRHGLRQHARLRPSGDAPLGAGRPAPFRGSGGGGRLPLRPRADPRAHGAGLRPGGGAAGGDARGPAAARPRADRRSPGT